MFIGTSLPQHQGIPAGPADTKHMPEISGAMLIWIKSVYAYSATVAMRDRVGPPDAGSVGIVWKDQKS
jgi:hypothetical protein